MKLIAQVLDKDCGAYALYSLSCFFVNARGLLSKIDNLRDYAIQLNLDIIGVAETFLNDKISQSEIGIDGYTIYRRDRNELKGGKGGGVILYIKNGIVSYENHEVNKSKSESVWCKIRVDKCNDMTIGVCYKSQVANEEELKELYEAINVASKGSVLIMGDFNFPSINWVTLECDSVGEEFRDIIYDNFLVQHVKYPTRENNILDLVLTSDINMIDHLEIREHLDNSDHNIITWKLICNIKIQDNKELCRQYHRANYDDMRNWLNDVDWNNEFENLDVDEVWTRFCSIMNLAVEKFVPLEHKKTQKYPKWMNRDARRAQKYKSKMWIRYRESRTYNDLVEYKRAQNKAVKQYRKAKRKFEKKLSFDVKSNPKRFYSYIRSRTKVKEIIGPLKDGSGQLISNDEQKCEILNEYFGSVFTEECEIKVIPEVNCKFFGEDSRMLRTINISEDVIINKIKRLKIGKAPGVDNIVPRILLENASILGKPLLYIFTKSMQCGKVPNDWKRANVTAIYKKDDKELPSNYRPISLTSHVCKLLESIIRDNVMEHLRTYKLINDSQHGFVSKRSCMTNLLEFLEFVSNYVDQGIPIDVIYLDFQKAFDKVPHKRLMLKIKSLGIAGEVYSWIADWLSDRQQRVVLLGNKSNWIEVKSGVPQGSVLGPLLFFIYINDIDESINTNILKFADDTKLYGIVANKDDVEKLQRDLIKICEWSSEWLMLFNVDKCKVMHIGHGNMRERYEMNGKNLNEVTEEKDLGVIMQNDLKCNKQCIYAVNKANRTLGMIKRTFSNFDSEVVLQLYKALVRPHLEYCIQVWRPYLKKDIELLEKVQRRATKLVPTLRNKSYEERNKCLGLTILETRRLRGDLIEVFKIFKRNDNIDREKFFKLNTNTHTRGYI